MPVQWGFAEFPLASRALRELGKTQIANQKDRCEITAHSYLQTGCQVARCGWPGTCLLEWQLWDRKQRAAQQGSLQMFHTITLISHCNRLKRWRNRQKLYVSMAEISNESNRNRTVLANSVRIPKTAMKDTPSVPASQILLNSVATLLTFFKLFWSALPWHF